MLPPTLLTPFPSIPLIIKHRLFSFAHTAGKQLSSSNFLVPLFAHIFGLESAALVKLASSMTHGITTIIEKVIDPTSSTLFAAITTRSHQEHRLIFSLINRTLKQLVLVMIIAITIIMVYATHCYSSVTHDTVYYMILYFMLHYCDTFFIPLERWYLAHNKPHFIIINVLLNFACIIICINSIVSPLSALSGLLVSRFFTFYFLRFFIVQSFLF